MEFDLQQLRALAAAVSEGTFEAAATALSVTPSAISQRIRALETATGRVLLVRSKPIRVTPSGEPVLRLAREIDLLAADAAAELVGDDEGALDPADPAARGARLPTLAVAVNADSLATWFLPALAPLASATAFHVLREDEGRTSALLRDGTVVAAVTTDAQPVAGCTVTPLGEMRYRPVASPDYLERWFGKARPITPEGLRRAPMLVFDRDDPLQHGYLRSRCGADAAPPVHMIPSSTDFAAAIRLGLGWGMLDELQLPDVAGLGPVVDLYPGDHVDVPLYWQQWRLRSPSLDRLAEAVVRAARAQLRQP